MAMAGGAKVEVLAFGEVDFKMTSISFTLGILGTLEHFRHSEGDGIMKRTLRGNRGLVY